MSKVRILIVEDELLVAEEMANKLKSRDFSVLEICESATSARHSLEIYQIDLLLIDIKLKGEEDGISLAKWVNQNYSIPVIFITSLVDSETIEMAVKARPSAYLVKPYNYRELEIAINMALYNFENKYVAQRENAVEIDNSHFLSNQHIFIKDKHRLERVELSEILWLKAESSYVSIHTSKKDYLLTSDTLGSLMERIKAPHLLRIHRSFAANMNKIQALEGNLLCLKNAKIPIGKNYRSMVKQHLRIL